MVVILFDVSIVPVNFPFFGNFLFCLYAYASVSGLESFGFVFILLTVVSFSKFMVLPVSTSNLHLRLFTEMSIFGCLILILFSFIPNA